MGKKKMSGGASLYKAGKKALLIGPTEEQKERIRIAAAIAGKSMAQFALDVTLEAAEKILQKNLKNS